MSDNLKISIQTRLFFLVDYSGSIDAPKMEHSQITELKPTLMSPMNTDTPAAHHKIDDFCFYDDRKFAFGEHFEIGCDSVCTCFAASRSVVCEPRCPPRKITHAMQEQCVTVPDPNDACCHIEFCDVTLDDHDEIGTQTMTTLSNQTSKDVTKSAAPLAPTLPTTTTIAPTAQPTTTTSGGDISAHDDDDGEYDCVHNGKKYKKGMQFLGVLSWRFCGKWRISSRDFSENSDF